MQIVIVDFDYKKKWKWLDCTYVSILQINNFSFVLLLLLHHSSSSRDNVLLPLAIIKTKKKKKKGRWTSSFSGLLCMCTHTKTK